ncbi:hypothetical protein DNTS_035138 [Danionella cerebrum]|uniref:Uncharacterized protein n=1 Tax=Danionella cerebrum TaxID=2873325 RepID=A0A553N602_9TELE|nr:hypothetical protein DNTS_035138 [Danionella translucida]
MTSSLAAATTAAAAAAVLLSDGTMQDYLLRAHMFQAKDEEAESQRKAKSRQARQTRRATQGVTLSELMEAKRCFSPTKMALKTSEVHEEQKEASSSEKCLSHSEKRLDEQGNWKRREISKLESNSFCSCPSKVACGGFTSSLKSHSNTSEIEETDENDNFLYGFPGGSTTQKPVDETKLSHLQTQVPL